jgi:hypothetical protein
MDPQRFALSYDHAWPLTVAGMAPRSSGVEVDSDEIRVRIGVAFSLDIPRGAVRTVSREPALGGQATWGVHGLAGHWVVNSSSRGLVELALEPPCYTGRGLGTLFRRARVNSLILSLADPDRFIAALQPDRPA